MDFAAAYFAGEAAGALGRLRLPGRAIGERASGATEVFGSPDTACHELMMRRSERVFQFARVLSSTKRYPDHKNPDLP